MKRAIIGIFLVISTVIFFGSTAHGSVNDFTIKDFQADYYLDKDADGRSTLKTVEVIVAEFPTINQNHGIERALPTAYGNHPTSLKIESIQMGNGVSVSYLTYSSNNSMVIRIGDKDTYVHGQQTYRITYTQRDVTRYFANTAKDEFYWNVNGTQWSQPFDKVTARIHIADGLKSAVVGTPVCYVGSAGSKDRCTVDSTVDGYVLATTDLRARQNVTFAAGFTAHTFNEYQRSVFDTLMYYVGKYWIISLIITTPLAIIILIGLISSWYSRKNRSKEQGTIIAEYLPPDSVSIATAARIVEGARAVNTAQLLDLAVRQCIKLFEVKPKTIWKAGEYSLQITKPIYDLRSEERELLSALFSGPLTVGSRLDMKYLKSSATISSQLQKNKILLTKRIREIYGLRSKDANQSKWFYRWGWILTVIAVLGLSPMMALAALVTFVLGATLWILTDEGLRLKRYLLGLKLYIGVAEADRIVMLQSPEGAEKVGVVDATDSKQLVKLYERVLPYAVLFGQEKEWNKQLGVYYETTGQQPDWYSGTTAFNAAVFAGAMTSFASTANSYASSSSSSSGGSDGGGSSGGGGGGGGGGGW